MRHGNGRHGGVSVRVAGAPSRDDPVTVTFIYVSAVAPVTTLGFTPVRILLAWHHAGQPVDLRDQPKTQQARISSMPLSRFALRSKMN